MPKFFLLAKLNRNRLTTPTRGSQRNLLTIQVLKVAVLAAIVVVGAVYLLQVNQISTRGFQLDQLHRRTEQLKIENKKLEIESANLQSMQRIQAAASTLDLVSVKNIEYLSTAGAAVALQKTQAQK